ncbi:MAG TPA: dihydrodipicolinate synthase family protein, partial [Acidimicrobiia bacterium]|nr:dihydrodipicolinate synthase family protein [Acidimicrobiia bacterium]
IPPRLLPALITPFDASGEPDLEAHVHNLDRLWSAGIRGFLVAGSTGEGPYLESGERFQLLKAARDQFEQAFLACGVAAETVRQALGMISEAVDGGADSALVMTPTTLTRNRPSYVESYFQAVAEASSIPVFLYSVPGVTAFDLPEALVVSLSQHPNIIGIKDSGGDPVRMQRLAAGVDDGFRLFTGSTQALTLAITAGAYGAITASTNYMPDLLLELVGLAGEDPIKARDLQRRVSAISTKVESHGIPGVKAAAGMIGLRSGLPRPPLAVLGEAEQALIAKSLKSTKYLRLSV